MESIQKIREYFPIVEEKKIFLNHAASSPLCKPAVEAIQTYLESRIFQREHGFHLYQARELFAQLIKAEGEEIALVPNASTGLSIVANILDYPNGSNVVTADLEFPTAIYPWLRKKLKLNVRYVQNVNGELRLQDFEKAVDDQTVAVVLSHVEYANGFRNDLRAIAEIAHQHGAFLVVDACQSAGVLNIDVKRDDVDFLTSSCYKWLLGPCGAGFLYVRKDLINEAEPAYVGWLGVKREIFKTTDLWDNTELRLSETARRFETGTPSIISFVGAAAALAMILNIGVKNIESRVIDLTNYLIDRLKEEGYELQTAENPDHRSGIVNFKIRNPMKMVYKLYQQGIFVSARMNGIRVSPHFYNTEEELDTFLSNLRKLS